MSERRCPQADLIEALHDGRLGPSESAAMQRHLAGCATCRGQLDDLGAVRAALRAPHAGPTPLEHQRARIALLRAAAGPVRGRSAPSPAWLLAVALVVAVSAAAGVATWGPTLWRSEPVPELPPAPAPATAPAATAPAPTGARADRSPRGRAAASPPEVAAEEAEVASTPQAAAPEIAPIEAAAPEAAAPEAAHAAPAALLPSAPRQVQARLLTPRVRPSSLRPSSLRPQAPTAVAVAVVEREPASPPVAATAPLVVPPAPALAPASLDFAEAMEALGAGDFGVAARRFAAFVAAWPADPRSDEASYLIAIAYERAGRIDAARTAARRYLEQRPTGAHRARAARLAAVP